MVSTLLLSLPNLAIECSTFSIVISTLSIIAACVYGKIQELKRLKAKLPFADIPYTVPSPHWFYGHLSLIGRDVTQGQHSVCVEHAGGELGLSTFYALGVPVLSILDAATAHRVLQKSSERRGHPMTVKHYKKMLGQHSLVMINGKEWRANRAIVQRSFAHTSLPDLREALLYASLRIEKAVLSTILNEHNQVFETDALNLSRIAALDAFGLSSLGHDFGCTKNNKLEQSEVFRITGYLQMELTRRCYHERLSPTSQFYCLPTAANRRHKREQKRLHEIFRGIVQQRRHDIEDGQTPLRNDLLGSVLKGSHGFNEHTDEFLSDWMITMLFGGYETSSLGLAYTLYMLAKYPSYQTECAKEAQNEMGIASDETTALENVERDLPFIHSCFHEALRCNPPTTATARNLDRPMVLDMDGKKRHLPKGSRVIFSLYWIHHSERNFPRPNEYLPERWAQKEQGRWVQRTAENDSGGDVPMGNRNSMLSFSSGARNCVGQPLAMRMIPTLLAVLLRSFEFELVDPSYELTLQRFGASLMPIGGIPIRIKRRNQI